MRYPPIHESRFRIDKELNWKEELLERPTTIATSPYIELINAAWTAAILRFPNEKLYLMHGARVMRKHPDDRSWVKNAEKTEA